MAWAFVAGPGALAPDITPVPPAHQFRSLFTLTWLVFEEFVGADKLATIN